MTENELFGNSEQLDDTISRQAAIDVVKKNTFRLTFAEEQNCGGHVAWSAEAVYSDVMEGALLDLPSAQPERKTGRWIPHEDEDGEHYGDKCSECGEWYVMPYGKTNFCPNCGADMKGDTYERFNQQTGCDKCYL